MTDRYERIRRALEMASNLEADPKRWTCALTELRLACDPDTLRELLAERDELLEALQLLFNAAYFGFATSVEFGRAEAAIAKATQGATYD